MAEYIISDNLYTRLIFAAGNHDYAVMDDVACELEKNEIVRCKDCKFLNRYDMSCRRWSHDNGVCYMAKHISNEGFCAWGERRAE